MLCPYKTLVRQTVGALKWALLSDITLEDCGWPPERALGSVPGTNCQNCHGSQIIVRFDESRGQYDTEVKDFRINCESCHGPGRRHRERIDAGEHLKSGDIGFEPAALDNVCISRPGLTCHANKMVLPQGTYLGWNFTNSLQHRPFGMWLTASQVSMDVSSDSATSKRI